MLKKIKRKILNRLRNLLKESNAISDKVQLDGSISVVGSFIGSEVTIGKSSKIIDSSLIGKISIGTRSKLNNLNLKGTISCGENCKFYAAKLDGNVTIGRNTSLWGPSLDIITGSGKVAIGNFCSIARNVYMQTFNHNTQKLTTYFIGKNVFKEKWDNEQVSKGDITIQNDVWIGTNVTILGGVKIGNGAVVAAGSVVTKDIPPFAIVGGVPAKVLDYRFESAMIDRIQKLAWWDWPIEKIKNNKLLFENEISEINKEDFIVID